MSREGLQLARVARAKGVPVVLSPICWIEPRAMAALATDPRRPAGEPGQVAAQGAGPPLADLAARPAPVGRRDPAQLGGRGGAARPLVRRRPGPDPRRSPTASRSGSPAPTPSAFRAIHGPGDFVLYVGRIEPRKNVLGLVEGVRAAGLPLVVIGDALPGYEGYADDCRRAGRGFARWLPRVDHDDPMLASAYAAARVLALPSWFETPGLVALEAALAGTAVVVTPHGCTREYFGDRVGYARPDRPSEIARAVADAWDDGPDPGLSGARRAALPLVRGGPADGGGL